MNSLGILSDQSFRWSATYAKEILRRPTKAPSGATWQAWLQMRQGTRPWSQVLLVRELPKITAANRLCSAEPSCRDQEIPRQLSTRSRNLRGDLRDQPRAAAPPRGALRTHDEHRFFRAHRADRSPISKHDRRQYARELVGLFTQCFDNCGGHR